MKQTSNFFVCTRLVGLVHPLAGYMVLAVAMGTVGHLCAAAIPILGGAALLDGAGVSAPLWSLLLLTGVLAVLRGGLHYGEQACNHFIAFKLLAILRGKVFAALRRLCPAKLEGRDRGNLIAIITSDIELLEVFYAHTISPVAIALLTSCVFCLVAGAFHPLFAVVTGLAHLTVGVAIPLVTSKHSGDAGMRFRTQSGELSSFLLDSLRGLGEILQYGGGARRLEQMNHKAEQLSKSEAGIKRGGGSSAAVTGAVILCFDLALLLVAALLYLEGAVSFGGVVLPVVTLMSSFGPVVALSNLGSGLQNTLAAGRRVLELLEEQPVTEEITGQPGCTFDGAQVRNVTFSYGGETILTDASADIPAGTVVGITGRSGSGKSTLLKLLMRFWSAQSGSVLISGRSIDGLNTANLRDMESYMTQETHLFQDSIAANLRIARPDATQAELETACKKAAIHSFIAALPQGYDTPVGELGDTLSGGERQRLGLARAFLHDAPLLLLDEPTSNLDSLNEALILKAVGEAQESRTVVLVSHRASTMALAQRVYQVERGRVSG